MSSVARNSASSTLCVMKKNIFFVSHHSLRISSWICSRVSASSAPSGSSISITSGSLASARARPTRCCMPPGELIDRVVGELLEPDQTQLVERHAPPLRLVGAAHPQAERDVVGDVEPGHQRVLLEHDAALGARARDRLAVEDDLARRVLHEAGDAGQERGLAAARRAERDDEVAGIERQVDVGERVRRLSAAAGVADGEVADFEFAHARFRRERSHANGAPSVGLPTPNAPSQRVAASRDATTPTSPRRPRSSD